MKRVAVAGVVVLAAVGVAAAVATDQPSTSDRPRVVNSADDARPGQTVARDAMGRTLVYVDGARDADLRAAVAEGEGVVLGTVAGRVRAAVPDDKLDVVAAQPGVTEVRLPERAVPMAVTSAGVGLSKADLWPAGKRGNGVRIGVIDVGFGGAADAQANGELPAGLTIDNSNCVDPTMKTPHGTAVAEIVYDMAPEASLYLACVEDSVGFSAAETWLRQQGVQVITAAVGFVSPTGGRGDGTGPADSPAGVVRRSREAGILWTVAAGNLARLHFAGKAVDANNDTWVEFSGQAQNNGYPLAQGAYSTVGIRWDAWPTTNEDLDLYVMKQAHPPTGPSDPDLVAVSQHPQKDTPGGLSPTEELTFQNTTGSTFTYWVYVKNNNARFTTSFDLFVTGTCGQLQTFTEAGSVTEPATSSYAMAVGATEAGSGLVETYSGRGPTVDGRQKPDITGFDKVGTSSFGQLAGTSAAAAHVAGAAAILRSANPALDAAQLQAMLQSKATPPMSDNTWGRGTLSLGVPDNVPVTSSGFTVAQTAGRVHSETYTPGQTKTLPFPQLPGDTTAVAVTVSARSDVDTSVDVAPGDPATSTGSVSLRVRGGNTFTSTTFFMPVNKTDRSIRIRSRNGNAAVVVDLLGYFSPSQSTDTYFAKDVPKRILDTRGFQQSPRSTPLGARQSQEVPIRGVAGVPATATSVVVNLTAFEATGDEFVNAYGINNGETVHVAVSQGDRRSNLVVVPIADDGKIRVINNAATGQVGVAVDVVGWFGPGAGGARYVALPEASRIADTATGNGLPRAQVGQGRSAQFQVGGLAGVSTAATTAALVVTGTEHLVGTDLTVRPAEAAWSPVTDVSTRKLEPAAGLVLTRLGASGRVDVRNDRGQASVSVDVTGYFVGGAKIDPASVGNCRAAADDPGYSSVFDGRNESSLDAWMTAGAKPVKVEGCELVTDTGNDVTWYTAHTYDNDYTLKLDWLSTTDNSASGVYVLTPNPGSDPTVPATRGLRVNIGPRGATGTQRTGGIDGLSQPSTTPPVKPNGEWNTFEIGVRWNTVTVTLNGVRINEYTTTDPARINRNSYFALRNSGTNDPVRFRNVRVKRDTPVRSGALVGVNNLCLDMFEGNPNLGRVWMFTCLNNFPQTWTSPGDGTIQAGGRCLASAASTADAPVTLEVCGDHVGQQWITRGDGRMVHVFSGRCLTPTSGSREAALLVTACDPARSDQIWRAPDQRGTSGKIIGSVNRCLEATKDANSVPTGTLLSTDCTPVVVTGARTVGVVTGQIWTAPGDGTLRAAGKCLDIAGAATAEGTPVAVWECHGLWNQQWVAQPDGTLVNPVSGRCLTASAGPGSAALFISTCTAIDRQIFRMTASTLSFGEIIGIGSKCVDLWGGTSTSTEIRLFPCNGGTGQFWNTPGDGTLRTFTRCADISSVANEWPTGLTGCQPNRTSQQWSIRPDGSIVNILANRCLDVRGGIPNDEAVLQIYDCYRQNNQRWATPARAS